MGSKNQARWKSKNVEVTNNLEKFIEEYNFRRQYFVGSYCTSLLASKSGTVKIL